MKRASFRKLLAVAVSVLMLMTSFVGGVSAEGDIDMDMGGLTPDTKPATVTASKMVDKNLIDMGAGAYLSGNSIVLNDANSYVEFVAICNNYVVGNFTADAEVKFNLFVDDVDKGEITVPAGTGDVTLISDLTYGEHTFKLVRTSANTEGAAKLNSVGVYGIFKELDTSTSNVAGDIDSNGLTNLNDVVLLAQHVAEWDVTVNEKAIDVNGDTIVNLNDVVTLAQYVAGWDDIIMNGKVYDKYNEVAHNFEDIQDKYKANSRATIDENVLYMNWSYAGFTINGQFSGDIVLTGVTNESDILAYCVIDNDYNNKKEIIINAGTTDANITIATGLAKGMHTVEFFKANEQAILKVKGIKYNGALFNKPAEKDIRINAISDSIGSGSGLLPAEQAGIYSSDISKAYTMKVARHFNAEFSITSCSGSTFAPKQYATCMKDKYFDTFLSSSKTGKYDFSKEAEPDVVLIGLGTNDATLYNGYGYTGTLTEQDLANNITSMLTVVRNQHQNATIIWVYGQMTGAFKDVYQETVNSFDDNTYYVHASCNDLGGINGHPTAAGQENITEQVIKFMEDNNIL